MQMRNFCIADTNPKKQQGVFTPSNTQINTPFNEKIHSEHFDQGPYIS